MKKHLWQGMATMLVIALFFASCQKDASLSNSLNSDIAQGKSKNRPSCTPGTWEVFAKDLVNPRGLKFGRDGKLYVAEGGTGGTHSTVGLCLQVPSISVGPVTGSNTGGRISVIDAWGNRTTLADNFPSSQTNDASNNLVSGVADVAFVGNNLYALLAGAGCSHGVTSLPNGIVKVRPNGSWNMIADLSTFIKNNPTAVTEEEDFEPDGSWYGMITVGGHLYAVEPNHGEMDRINPGGKINRVIDISASQGHIVPTVAAYRDGNFYVGNLHPFPIIEGSSKILKISADGKSISTWATGFTTILGVVFDGDDNLYVLENTTGVGNFGPTPFTGKVVKVSKDGTKTIVASGLSLPTGMTFGPDGYLYVSNWGFGPPPQAKQGQILKICVGGCARTHDDEHEDLKF